MEMKLIKTKPLDPESCYQVWIDGKISGHISMDDAMGLSRSIEVQQVSSEQAQAEYAHETAPTRFEKHEGDM